MIEFVIRNSSGNKTGAMSATAVKRRSGNWFATLTHTFKITTVVDAEYMAELKGSPKIWVVGQPVEQDAGQPPMQRRHLALKILERLRTKNS